MLFAQKKKTQTCAGILLERICDDNTCRITTVHQKNDQLVNESFANNTNCIYQNARIDPKAIHFAKILPKHECCIANSVRIKAL